MAYDSFPGSVSWLAGFLLDSTSGQLLVLLLAGHVLGDFVFQSRRMVRDKQDSAPACGAHALQVAFWQAIACAPFLRSITAFLLVLLVGVAHYWIDRGKVILERKHEPRMRWFLLDQALHAFSLLAVWKLWTNLGADVWPVLSEEDLRRTATAALVIAVYGANVNGGSAIVSYVLRWLPKGLDGEEAQEPSAGRIIGILERMMILTLAWQGEWGAVGMVIAAKSVARFKELDDKRFAEAYIVGTLTSVLLAMLGGILLRAVF